MSCSKGGYTQTPCAAPSTHPQRHTEMHAAQEIFYKRLKWAFPYNCVLCHQPPLSPHLSYALRRRSCRSTRASFRRSTTQARLRPMLVSIGPLQASQTPYLFELAPSLAGPRRWHMVGNLCAQKSEKVIIGPTGPGCRQTAGRILLPVSNEEHD